MAWLRRVTNVFRTGRLTGDIDREIAFHVAERAEQLRQQGFSEEEARHRARLQFGNALVQRERTRDVNVAESLDTVVRNVRHACRCLARTPAFTSTVVLTLAIGIGANAAVFSAIEAVLLRPLPFPEPERLVRLTHVTESLGEADTSAARLADWDRLSSTFAAITYYRWEDVSDTTGETAQPVRRATVGPRFLEVVGIPPALGRGFSDTEHRLGGVNVALISDGYWRQRFGADHRILGRPVRAADRSYTIVGVLPPGFDFPAADVDWWVPQAVSAPPAMARALSFSGVGRLAPGVSPEQALADLEAVQAQLAQQFPNTDRDVHPRVTPLKDAYVGDARPSLWLLFGSVTVLLLIACTNIAALLLTRGQQRQQEIAIRQALGGSRRAVALHLLTESTVLAVAGASAGVLLAMLLTTGLATLAPAVPRLDTAALSGTVWRYLAIVTTAVAMLCGLVPAFRGSKLSPTRTGTPARVVLRQPIHWWLVGVQVALAVTLLTGAGLLVRSLDRLSRVNAGFEPAGVLTFRVTGSFAETRDYSRVVQRINRTLDALSSLPGVDAAATTIMLPGLPDTFRIPFAVVEAPPTGPPTTAAFRFVSPSYFRTTRMPVLEGELCRDGDVTGSSEVMINRAFAVRYLSGRSPVGMHIAFGDAGGANSQDRIVGIVGDAREGALSAEPVPTVYPCFSATQPMPWFLVHSSTPSGLPVDDIRSAVRSVDPLRSVYDVVPLDARIGGVYAPVRVRTILLALFAITALLLACLGVYGALSYVVSLRQREAGLRLALGASRVGIVRQFCGHAMRVIGVACVVGLLLSVAFTRTLSGMLFGVSPLDPLTLSGVIALVLTVGSISALLPSVRAASAEPARVLQSE
jgi:putative ABC transport system permease protein